MAIPGISESTLALMEKNLDIRLKKHQLLVSNIANIDTPDYKPFNIVVKDALAKMNDPASGMRLETSNPGHMGKAISDQSTVEIVQEEGGDIDKAMSDLAKNTMLYNATAQILTKKYSMLKQTINGGK